MLLSLLKSLDTRIVYIQIWKNRLLITNNKNENVFDEQVIVAIDYSDPNNPLIVALGNTANNYTNNSNITLIFPFDHPRIMIDNFEVSVQLIQHSIKATLTGRSFIPPSPTIIIQSMEYSQGELSQIELRALIYGRKFMSSNKVNAFAAQAAGEPLVPFQFQQPELAAEEVNINVEYCSICHSDLSMWNNDWGMTQFPLVPGHEAIGVITAIGDSVKGLSVGQRVGFGWLSDSCMHCQPCMTGDHNLCGTQIATIGGRHGGFADQVRCHWAWAVPIPESLDPVKAGSLLCGGITVFNPIVQANVLPTHKVGVIGIGGFGHLALQFLNKWGCEVVAFSSSPDKSAELKQLGAHQVLNSRDSESMKEHNGTFYFILNTTNVTLDWNAYLDLLNAKGKLHTVGAVLEPMAIPAFSLISGQRSVSGSPIGSPALIKTMLDFCARHDISPQVEQFAISDVNEAMQHLESGKARYRVVLKV